MKNINIILMHRDKFYQLHTETTTAVAISKLSGKTDPLEIREPTIFENSRLGFI